MSKKIYTLFLSAIMLISVSSLKAQNACFFPSAFQVNSFCNAYVTGLGFESSKDVYYINAANQALFVSVAFSSGQIASPVYNCATANMIGGRAVQLSVIISGPISLGSNQAIITNPANWTCTAPIAGQVVLPVKFLSFTGKFNKENGVQLDWGVTFEHEMNYYAIEKSTYGSTFTEAGRITSSNYNGRDNAYYTFTDNSVSTGTVYYRIKEVDKDGRVDYSKIVVLNNGIKGTINVFPNPFIRQIQIFGLNQGELNTNNVRLFNTIGLQIAYKVVNNNTIEVDGNLQTGTYFLKVKNQTVKLIKQ
jgi:Secretion system C-terminal sorting domain